MMTFAAFLPIYMQVGKLLSIQNIAAMTGLPVGTVTAYATWIAQQDQNLTASQLVALFQSNYELVTTIVGTMVVSTNPSTVTAAAAVAASTPTATTAATEPDWAVKLQADVSAIRAFLKC